MERTYPVKARIRLDYRAEAEERRFLRRPPDPRETAKSIRAQQVSLLRNLPFQGLDIEDLDLNQEVYVVPEDETGQAVAYAPVELLVKADSLSDLMQLTLREEFRKIKVLEPTELALSNNDVERFIFRVAEEYQNEVE